MPYKIYTEVNLAETSRDDDDIRYEDVGYAESFPDALKIANNYIKSNFTRNETKLVKEKNSNNYVATDSCSWGETIYIEEIKID